MAIRGNAIGDVTHKFYILKSPKPSNSVLLYTRYAALAASIVPAAHSVVPQLLTMRALIQ